MNAIQEIRRRANVTQQELALLAGTSQSTIAAYESGAKSPTLRTVERLAAAVGLRIFSVFAPPMTREDRRSLAYHRAVSEKLARDANILTRARRTLALQTDRNPDARALLDLWRCWLDLPLPHLIPQLLSPDLLARDMRQVSPFAGVLTPGDRARVLKRFKATEAA